MPKQIYIFIPYGKKEGNNELKQLALEWKKSALAQNESGTYHKNKIPKIIHYNPEEKNLAILQNENPENYKIYVLGHGKYENTTITNQRTLAKNGNLPVHKLTPKELVLRLQASGLPKDVENLSLYMCNSGRTNTSDISIASEVSKELCNLGWKDLEVQGYIQPVVPQVQNNKHKLYFNPDTNQSGRPSDIKHIFKSGIRKPKPNEGIALFEGISVNKEDTFINALKILDLIESDLKQISFESVKNITPTDIKDNYKKLALKLHPDKTGGKTTEDFKRLNSAYDTVLKIFDLAKFNELGYDKMKNLFQVLKGYSSQDREIIYSINPKIKKLQDAYDLIESCDLQNNPIRNLEGIMIAAYLEDLPSKLQATLLNEIKETQPKNVHHVESNLKQEMLTKITSYYKHAVNNINGRKHGSLVEFEQNQNLVVGKDDDYRGMKGDALKTRILINLRNTLKDIDNYDELEDTIKRFKESYEYKILNTKQDISSKIFFQSPSSIKAFKDLCAEAKLRITEAGGKIKPFF